MFDFMEHSHKRFNPLNNTWVLCSPHRAKRPWLGQQESIEGEKTPEYIDNCFLCPGNKRINGELNPKYQETFVFENDFPAVKANQPEYDQNEQYSNDSNHKVSTNVMKRLFKAEGVRGCARVICFSPKHNLTMAEMDFEQVLSIIHAWKAQLVDLKRLDYINYVQLFENKGSVMGCSNPHPHGQVWATQDIPQEPAAELASLSKYQKENASCLLCDLVNAEMEIKDRIVCENDNWICIVPFWAVWPFETLLLPKKHFSSLEQLDAEQEADFAKLLVSITAKYDNLFQCSFPYSMGIHGAPIRDDLENHCMHLHVHFYPPLLRSATVKKFLVGFEMLGQAQRDLTAEQAAKRLRDLPLTHYKKS